MSDRTQINPALNEQAAINRAGSATVINPSLSAGSEVRPGTTLPGGYTIKQRLNAAAGEADIFVCEKDGEEYVAKLYRRRTAIKSEVIAALREVKCPYIAPLYYSDVYNGMPFEILPYYRRGSLQGRRFTFEDLKKRMIPEINEALAALHDAGIIHKDLKPSNIMLTDSGDIAMIDFGISSLQTGDSTVVVTSTGMTPEYSAPETFRKLFLEESDYYSFGITLYELYCGKTPYAEMNAEEIARYTAIQRIPLPDSMPRELRELISALTYYDITNRRHKSNPNRRWTYAEVDNWCRGIEQPVPGEGTEPARREFPVYTFMDRRLTNIHELVTAFAGNWEQGKKQVFRGILSGFLKPFDPQLAGYAIDAEEAAANGADTDVEFFRLLYRLDPETKAFCWKDRRFESISAFGEYILDSMNDGSETDAAFIGEVLSQKLISVYVQSVCPGDKQLVEAAKYLEDMVMYGRADERSVQLSIYSVGFALSGDKSLRVDGKRFGTVDELVIHLKKLLAEDYILYEDFFSRLIGRDMTLDVQFEAWLYSLGKREEVGQWKQQTR